jgi:hypothetical protein
MLGGFHFFVKIGWFRLLYIYIYIYWVRGNWSSYQVFIFSNSFDYQINLFLYIQQQLVFTFDFHNLIIKIFINLN